MKIFCFFLYLAKFLPYKDTVVLLQHYTSSSTCDWQHTTFTNHIFVSNHRSVRSTLNQSQVFKALAIFATYISLLVTFRNERLLQDRRYRFREIVRMRRASKILYNPTTLLRGPTIGFFPLGLLLQSLQI